jgi:hypothetical protein
VFSISWPIWAFLALSAGLEPTTIGKKHDEFFDFIHKRFNQVKHPQQESNLHKSNYGTTA